MNFACRTFNLLVCQIHLGAFSIVPLNRYLSGVIHLLWANWRPQRIDPAIRTRRGNDWLVALFARKHALELNVAGCLPKSRKGRRNVRTFASWRCPEHTL